MPHPGTLGIMAFDAYSPLGVSWGHLALGLVAILIFAALLLAEVRRRRKLTPWLSWLVLAALAGALWTCLSVGAPVTVSGAQCVWSPFGEASDNSLDWGNDCDRALLQRVVISAGPSVALLGLVMAAVLRGGRLARVRTPSGQ
jgi:hypothetical protein